MSEKKIVTGKIDHRRTIRKEADKLAQLLIDSPEYARLSVAKKRLEGDGEKARILAELRQQQFTVHMASVMGDDMSSEANLLESSFALMTQEPVIRDYLFAEGRFLNLMADVEEVFSSKLELLQSLEDDAQTSSGYYNINLN